MTRINLITAVSRERNLPRILDSIRCSLRAIPLEVQWILVFDAPGSKLARTKDLIKTSGRIKVLEALYEGGPMKFGIHQKNLGMDLIEDGFYHCLDDDNIVHPEFFSCLLRAIESNPGKRAFAFAQIRWDHHGTLTPSVWSMNPGQIDNTMFVVHKDLIGSLRYEKQFSGWEDGIFFQKIFSKHREEFVFVKDQVTYYNYLKRYPQ